MEVDALTPGRIAPGPSAELQEFAREIIELLNGGFATTS